MKKKYRITLHNGPEGGRDKCVKDVFAESFEDARHQMWQMDEVKRREYSEASIEQVPEGPSVIGVCYEYVDPGLTGKSSQYMFIKANSEGEAIRYYNNHYRNTHFDFPNSKKIDDAGRCTRGRIVETYFAHGVAKYDADATIDTKKVIADVLADATARSKENVKKDTELDRVME